MEIIIIDNGPEFIGKALDAWAYQREVRLAFITPGKPVENAYIESFNGGFRDECLNENWFMILGQAREIVEAWRVDGHTARWSTCITSGTANGGRSPSPNWRK